MHVSASSAARLAVSCCNFNVSRQGARKVSSTRNPRNPVDVPVTALCRPVVCVHGAPHIYRKNILSRVDGISWKSRPVPVPSQCALTFKTGYCIYVGMHSETNYKQFVKSVKNQTKIDKMCSNNNHVVHD